MRINLGTIAWSGIAAWLVSKIIGTEASAEFDKGDDPLLPPQMLFGSNTNLAYSPLSVPVTRLRPHPRPHTFSEKDFDGSYAFQITGLSSFYLTNEPTVATGVMIANGKGGLSGHGIFRVGTYLKGWISCDVTITGGYSVGTNGLGNIGATGSTSTPGCTTNAFDFNIVLPNDGALIQLASSENDCMSGTLFKQSVTEFSVADLDGDYGLNLQGTSSVVLANEPQTAGVAILTAYGNGTVTGTATFRSAGYTCPGTFQDGVYSVDSDGTGGIYMNWFPLTFGVGCFPSVVNVDLAMIDGNSFLAASSDNDELFVEGNRLVYR